MLGTIAMVLALVFFFTVTARWLNVFAGPAYHFLRESWALSGDEQVQELRKTVALVHIDGRADGSRGQFSGTGFNIAADGLVVTNRHIVEGAASIRVSFTGRGTFVARDWHIFEHADLALIEIDAHSLPVATIASARPQLGDEVLVIGNPLQFARIANKGLYIGANPNIGRATPFLVVQAMIYPGNSGSPLFNEQGEVVGVIFATLRNRDPAEVKGLAVDVAELKIFLEELEELEEVEAMRDIVVN